jgi:ubiquinol-cytochrome c reductase cytochrome b subunit
VFALCLAGAAALGGQARYQDAHNPRLAAHEVAAKEEALRARKLALQGVPTAGGVAVYENDPLQKGRRLFAEHCAQCHRLGRMGPSAEDEKGPDLTGLYSRAWLEAFLLSPDSPRFYGRTKLKDGMNPVKLPQEELRDLIEYVYALGGPPADGKRPIDGERVKRGALLYEDKNCDLCHERDGKTSGQGPNLAGYGTAQYLQRFLQAPSSPLHFGEKNDMPAFGKKLTAVELQQLSSFLLIERLR